MLYLCYVDYYISSIVRFHHQGATCLKISLFTISGSLLALGALFGSLSAVYLMDAVGRKASLLAFSVMSLFIGWTLLMAASQVWQLYTGRFLLGLGAGMEITICPVYIHEICRPALRDVCGSFPQVSKLSYLLDRLKSPFYKVFIWQQWNVSQT